MTVPFLYTDVETCIEVAAMKFNVLRYAVNLSAQDKPRETDLTRDAMLWCLELSEQLANDPNYDTYLPVAVSAGVYFDAAERISQRLAVLEHQRASQHNQPPAASQALVPAAQHEQRSHAEGKREGRLNAAISATASGQTASVLVFSARSMSGS
ncbi:hypothetical protein DOTSEDRAFT_26298 [Dothistroma septosporum NZE10]|uniref:Uncharacterized protein n=1 Tax=Dothistroma septosporum (strain NZE10 / CBS 128990) TaxID=675120 RepID=N1PK28_DOTSN|nr:hypothetical protein DOTSEDRAFT_26298 [Dothistroma septosporum NZE10]